MNRFFKLKKELKTKSLAEIVYYNLKKREFFLFFFSSHFNFLFNQANKPNFFSKIWPL